MSGLEQQLRHMETSHKQMESMFSQQREEMEAERSEHAATVTRLQGHLSSAVAEAAELQMALENKKTKVSLGTLLITLDFFFFLI